MGSDPICWKTGSDLVLRLALIPLLAFSSGCATNYLDPSLDEAAPTPTARLILKSRNGIASFRAFDDSALCGKPRVIGDAVALQSGEDDEADIGIAADSDFSFSAQQVVADGKVGCRTLVTFRPAAGQRYLATFTGERGVCSIDLKRIVSAVPPRIAEEPTFRVRRASSASGASCDAE